MVDSILKIILLAADANHILGKSQKPATIGLGSKMG
jgi:hypothetical protein